MLNIAMYNIIIILYRGAFHNKLYVKLKHIKHILFHIPCLIRQGLNLILNVGVTLHFISNILLLCSSLHDRGRVYCFIRLDDL